MYIYTHTYIVSKENFGVFQVYYIIIWFESGRYIRKRKERTKQNTQQYPKSCYTGSLRGAETKRTRRVQEDWHRIKNRTPEKKDITNFKCVVQLLSRVQRFVTPWTAACQASLSFTICWSLLKLMSIESVMPINHIILCHPLLLSSIFPSISPSNEYSGLTSFRIDWVDLLAVQGTLKSLFWHHSSKHQFFSAQPSLWSNSHICTWLLEKQQLWL